VFFGIGVPLKYCKTNENCMNIIVYQNKWVIERAYKMVRPNMKDGYLTLRSILSLNNPQNSEMWKYKVDMLKIIIIIIGYTLNNFIALFTTFTILQ
jgi:hypothetical protein